MQLTNMLLSADEGHLPQALHAVKLNLEMTSHLKYYKTKSFFTVHSIKLLGMGDARYRRIKSNLLEAIRHLGWIESVDEINNLHVILAYKVSSVPAILMDENVVFECGDIPSTEQLEAMLLHASQEACAPTE